MTSVWTRAEIGMITPNMACRCCGALFLRPVLMQRFRNLQNDLGVGLIVTNAYRCTTHNAAVGGHPQSRHIEGLAIDVVDMDIADFESIARRHFGGVLRYRRKNIWHLQVPPPRVS